MHQCCPLSPWVANAIGKGNRHYFLTLVWLNLYAALVSAVVGAIQVTSMPTLSLFEDQLSQEMSGSGNIPTH